MVYDEELVQPLDRVTWERREVYASFGAAIYQCQLIETGLVIYLGLLTRMKSGKPMTPDEVDELQAKFFENTFGRNIVQVRKLLGTAGKWILDDQMREALELRNQLTHHWMRERVMLLDTSENRLAVIAELEAATTQIEQADQLLTRRTLQLMKAGGVSLEAMSRSTNGSHSWLSRECRTTRRRPTSCLASVSQAERLRQPLLHSSVSQRHLDRLRALPSWQSERDSADDDVAESDLDDFGSSGYYLSALSINPMRVLHAWTSETRDHPPGDCGPTEDTPRQAGAPSKQALTPRRRCRLADVSAETRSARDVRSEIVVRDVHQCFSRRSSTSGFGTSPSA